MRNETPHDDYLDTTARRVLLEMGALQSTEYTIGKARVVVDWAYIPLSTESLSPSNRIVTVYIAGMPHNPNQNAGGDAHEIGLISELLTGSATDLIVMKPEGLNKEAFEDRAYAETQASHDRFNDICRKHGIDPHAGRVTFKFVGLSEGANQVVSLVRSLLSDGIDISEVVAVDPAGVVGYESTEKARIWPQSVEKFRTVLSAFKGKPDTKTALETPTGYSFSSELLQNYSDALQHGNQQTNPVLTHDNAKDFTQATKKNIVDFIRRLSLGLLRLKTPRGIQPDRMKHVWTSNPDYGTLADSDVPIIMFSMSGSLIAPKEEISAWVADRQSRGQNVSLVTSAGGHFGPSAQPKGVGAALAFYRNTQKAQAIRTKKGV